MDEPLNLVLFSGTDDKLQAAAVLAAGAAALGKPVNVFPCRRGGYSPMSTSTAVARLDGDGLRLLALAAGIHRAGLAARL
jgi:hypothetical protein